MAAVSLNHAREENHCPGEPKTRFSHARLFAPSCNPIYIIHCLFPNVKYLCSKWALNRPNFGHFATLHLDDM